MSLVTGNMITCMENYKESIKKLLELIVDFSKVTK